jgi:RND family efflux transporter MFP subunit
MNEPNDHRKISRREKFALTIAAIGLLVAAGGAFGYMMKNKPRPQRQKPPKVAPMVKVKELQPADHRVVIPAMGTVIPATEIDLKARVGGQVSWTSPELVEGGIIRRGQALLKIDPADYELILTRKKAIVEKAVYDLKAEQGRQEVAAAEWEILGLGENATELDRELALRRPQLAAAEAALKAAEAEVSQAELDLQRTVIKAPFNAVVRAVAVDVGAQVTTQGMLAQLAGTDTFYVQAAVPLDRISWLYLPDGPGSPVSEATIRTSTGRERSGKVFKLLGDIEPNGRLARLLIEVKDPMDLKLENGERRPLLLGDYVSTAIAGRTLENVINIPRQFLKDGNVIWALKDGRLEIVDVDVAWREEAFIFTRSVVAGTKLIVSDLSAGVGGMMLRVEEQK